VDHLQEAKEQAAGSCRSQEVERGQLHAAIAQVEALHDIRSAIELFNGKLDAVLRLLQPALAEKPKPKAKATAARRKAATK